MVSLKNLGNWLSEALWGDSSARYVTPDNALSYPAIWYAVNKISGHVGQLPMILHRVNRDGTRLPAVNHPAYRLMKTAPNAWQTPVVFKELMQTHALLWGNAYAYIGMQGNVPVELIPLYPGRTAPDIVKGEKLYLHMPENTDDAILKYKQPNDSGYISLSDREVFHLPGLGFNGYAGKSLWKVASDSWSIGLESDKRIKNGFQKGFKAAMLLEAPPEAIKTPEQAQEILEAFNKYHSGSENADKVGLLTRGIKANVVQMNSQEAQMVEHRNYQRQDTALWFLLESILGDNDSVSYNSLEQKNLAYLSNCLMRWLVKWEEEANRKLLPTGTQAFYFKFNSAALLRADHKTTLESLSIGITSRIYSPNEAREKLDMNPYDGGDSYENPAITPGQTGGSGDGSGDSSSSDQVQQIKMNRLQRILATEIKRVIEKCDKTNFVSEIDKFYDGWVKNLGDVMEEIGEDRKAAAAWCSDRKEELLSLADFATTKEELKDAVTHATEAWAVRIGELLLCPV